MAGCLRLQSAAESIDDHCFPLLEAKAAGNFAATIVIRAGENEFEMGMFGVAFAGS